MMNSIDGYFALFWNSQFHVFPILHVLVYVLIVLPTYLPIVIFVIRHLLLAKLVQHYQLKERERERERRWWVYEPLLKLLAFFYSLLRIFLSCNSFKSLRFFNNFSNLSFSSAWWAAAWRAAESSWLEAEMFEEGVKIRTLEDALSFTFCFWLLSTYPWWWW